jgi:carbonic anhydrase
MLRSDRITDMVKPGFADILHANEQYAATFRLAGLRPEAAKGLGVLTCMDSRIEPLALLGVGPGDAKIFRNAGARVTGDSLRSLVLAVHLLEVHRIAVIAHTRCKMTEATDDELRVDVGARAGHSADDWEFLAVPDQRGALADDLAKVRACPLIPETVEVGGFIYDVDTGRLELVATA